MSKFVGRSSVASGDNFISQSGEVADGYVGFFVGDQLMAGDEDLIWDQGDSKLTVPNLQVTTDSATDYILKSDATGNATWQHGMEQVMQAGFVSQEDLQFMFWADGTFVYES